MSHSDTVARQVPSPFKHILVIADIEGSSGCWSYEASRFMTRQWRRACYAMSRDVDAVVGALFDAGATSVTVKDFHRTAYNLLPERIDSRARVISGYRRGPIPGMGDPRPAEAVVFVGMHAASGGGGFLAHTLTSRIACLRLQDRLLPEVALFAGVLAPYDIRPVFFSGCPVACEQAAGTIAGIHTYAIDKDMPPGRFDAPKWRQGLARAAAASLQNDAVSPYRPTGPFEAVATLRDGPAAAKRLASRWGLPCDGADVHIAAATLPALYMDLVRLCYLTPFLANRLTPALGLFNLKGRLGLAWVRATGQANLNKDV